MAFRWLHRSGEAFQVDGSFATAVCKYSSVSLRKVVVEECISSGDLSLRLCSVGEGLVGRNNLFFKFDGYLTIGEMLQAFLSKLILNFVETETRLF